MEGIKRTVSNRNQWLSLQKWKFIMKTFCFIPRMGKSIQV